MRIKSIPGIVSAISEVDRHTAVNPGVIRFLIEKKKIRSYKIGKKGQKIVADFEQVIEDLNAVWEVNDNSSIPRIRSIHDAYLELRVIQPELGISEATMRTLVKQNRLPHIKMGNRVYIALESFEYPYVDHLFDEEYWSCVNEEKERLAQEKAQEAMERLQRRMAKTK